MKKLLLFIISLMPLSSFSMDNNQSYWNKFKMGISNAGMYASVRMRRAFGHLQEYGTRRLAEDQQQRSARQAFREYPARTQEHELSQAYYNRRRGKMQANINEEKAKEAEFNRQVETGTVPNPFNISSEHHADIIKARQSWYPQYYQKKGAQMRTLDRSSNAHTARQNELQKQYNQSIPVVQKQLRQTAKYPYKFGSQFE